MLHVNEIFDSISGEVGIIPQGALTTFLRLQGCNLRCAYCDAKNSQDTDTDLIGWLSLPYIEERVYRKNGRLLVTGGEPLLQYSQVERLCIQLSGRGKFTIQLETNGTKPIFSGNTRIRGIESIVMDYKLDNPPLRENFKFLYHDDWVKIVVSDLSQLKDVSDILSFFNRAEFNLAVSATDVTMYPEIIRTVRKVNPRTIINAQLHKFIGVS